MWFKKKIDHDLDKTDLKEEAIRFWKVQQVEMLTLKVL